MHGPRGQGQEEIIGEINVIPFIDVCLVLLIIVLMTSATAAKLVALDLPTTITTEYRDMNLAVTLSINKKGEFFFEDEEKAIRAKNLWTALKTIQGGQEWPMLVIRADRDTPYEYLALAIQCAQTLGIEDLSLAVQQHKQASRPR